MNILIFGASGKTGKYLLSKGLAKGHHFTAFVRNPQALPVSHARLHILQGDISQKDSVTRAMRGQDVVISVLGNKTSHALWKKSHTISDGLQNILEGMRKEKIARIIFVTSFGVSEKIFLPEKIFIRTFLRNIFADIPQQERLIRDSGLEYTIVRPARLTMGEEKGTYIVGENIPIGIFSHISRSDLADFLLKSIGNKKMRKKTVVVRY